jgi:glucosamine--fructose-6-phosphate aminotransferase (isomerizing)
LLALYLTQAKKTMPREWINEIIAELRTIPYKAEEILKQACRLEQLAKISPLRIAPFPRARS